MRVTDYVSGAPTASIGAADLSGSAVDESLGSNCLIYKEGGTETGPVVFNDFNELMAQKALIVSASGGAACVRIMMDTSLVAGITTIPLPTIAPYPFENTILDGGESGALVLMEDGVTVSGMYLFENFITVRNQNTLVPLEVMANNPRGVRIICSGNSGLETINGGQPFYDVNTNSVAFVFLGLLQGSRLGFNTTGTIFGGGGGVGFAAGSFIIPQIYDANPVQPPLGGSHTPDLIQGAVGSMMLPQAENTKSMSITSGAAGTALPSFLGTVLSPQLTEPAFLIPNPVQGVVPSTVQVTASLGESLSLDTTGGSIAQTLPSISGASFAQAFPGGFFQVTDIGTVQTNRVTLSAGAGDTVGGAATFVMPSGGSVLLWGDGISAWEIISVYDPLDKAYAGISAENQGTIISLPTQSVFVQYDQFDTDDPSLNTTPDSASNNITVDVDGDYLVTMSVDFQAQISTPNDYEWEAQLNNGATRLFNVHGEATTPGAPDTYVSTGGAGIVSLSAGDTVEVWVRCTTSNGQGVRGRNASLSIVKVS